LHFLLGQVLVKTIRCSSANPRRAVNGLSGR
jgi:hypothetical protein